VPDVIQPGYRFAAVGVNSSSRIANTVDDFSGAAAGLAVKHIKRLLLDISHLDLRAFAAACAFR